MSVAPRTILLTGATSGIGYQSALQLAKQGHHLVMVGRDRAKTERCVNEVKQATGNQAVEFLLCDFASQASIRAMAAEALQRFARIDVLINNAGTVFEKRQLTADGIEATWATNHLGYFLLTNLLLERLVASAPARVVVVASIGHYQGTMNLDDVGFEQGGYGIMAAYRRSKLANVMMTRTLARKLEGKGVTVNALHPGGVATSIWDGAPGWSQPILAVLKRLVMITPEEGGQTLTYLATSSEVEGKTGLYFEKNKPKTAAKLALDDTLAERVWAKSAAMVSLPH